MAKFFLTNNASIYNSLKESIDNSDFDLSFSYSENNCFALATHKLNVKNTNVAVSGLGFCITIGTCVYKESLSYDTLLKDFEGNFSETYSNMLGQYAVCINKDGRTSVFGDEYGCFDIYYYESKSGKSKEWLVSNSLYDMARVLKKRLTLDDFTIIERTINRTLVNGSTFFREIHRLRAGERIIIEDNSKEINIQRSKLEYSTGSYDEVVNRTTDLLRNNARIIAKVFGIPQICATGGLDSRLIISAFLAAGVKPNLLYGVGDNRVSSPKKEDERIIEQMSSKLKLKCEKCDFSASKPFDLDWNYYIERNGFPAAYMWGSQRNIIHNLCDNPGVIIFGFGGEVYRTSWLGTIATPQISLKTLLSQWKRQGHDLVKKSIDNYDEIVEEHFVEECRKIGVDTEKIGIDETFLIENSYRNQADTQIPSFVHQYRYCYQLLFEYEALKNSVIRGEKENAKFVISLIKQLYPKLLDIPIFTHEMWMYLDSNCTSLLDNDPTYSIINSSSVVSRLRKYSPEPFKRFFLRPLLDFTKRIFQKEYVISNAQESEIERIDKLDNMKYYVEMTKDFKSEHRSMYAMLLLALKKLDF